MLILGGYGNFGKRIAESLSASQGITVIIAGRNLQKAQALCTQLAEKGVSAMLEPSQIDIGSANFEVELERLSPDLVIHTSGPFQGQTYRVPEACIAVGSHYIDLADDRRFVCDIQALNAKALERKVLLVSGASSVPGLSSVVIDHFLEHFSSLEEIDFAIAPGNRAERGEATVKGILSYTGHPFPVLHQGQWVDRYGWMSPRKLCFGDVVGSRWLANVDIPDLELFPKRYPSANTVRFQAGLELSLLHLGMVFMALWAKLGLVKDWSRFTRVIIISSEIFKRWGTDVGGMKVMLSGRDKNNQPKRIHWLLCAEHGVGPYIPTLSAIILAKKLIVGSIDQLGAMPCLGLFTLEEFDQEAKQLGIYHHTEFLDG
ncbi:saccharopine dehydrogenase NADP-binding domain-containing protein [Maricurvus nonylphenolicus]